MLSERPKKSLMNETRADPRLLLSSAFKKLSGPPLTLSRESSYESKLKLISVIDQIDDKFHPEWDILKFNEEVDIQMDSLVGPDENNIEVIIHRPKSSGDQTLPCVVQIHGGGMCMNSMHNKNYHFFRSELAALGYAVIGFEFRNSAGRLGNYPFPAGLNDCVTTLKWVSENKSRLSLSDIFVSGDSGGANLMIAACLKLKREGNFDFIKGIYALCPFVFGQYGTEEEDRNPLPSLMENNGLYLESKLLGIVESLYDPTGENKKNPLAWPYWVEIDELRGFPSIAFSLNELDPLHDEGLEMYRKFLKAGVTTKCNTVHGTTHATEILIPLELPEIFYSTLNDIDLFFKRLVSKS